MNQKIYIITNNVNDKVYIGQTIQTLAKRFASHKSASKTKQGKLYSAMRRYGSDNFKIELLEDNVRNLDCAEIYYISKYNSYHNGYNGTIGGEGTSFYNFSDEEKLDIGIMYEELKSMTPICQKYNVSRSVIYNILIDLNVTIERCTYDMEDIVIYFLIHKSFKLTLEKFAISRATLIHYLKVYDVSNVKNTVDYDLVDEVIINSFDIATVTEMAQMANCSRTVIQNRKKDFGLVKNIDDDSIVKDFQKGMSKAALATKYKCSKYKINKVVGKSTNYFKKNNVKQLIQLHSSLSNKELAAIANCSAKTIYRAKKELAI